jgi:hypothetical protein
MSTNEHTTNTADDGIERYKPVEPFLAEHKRRPTVKRDGIVAWLTDEIAYLESIERTEFGDGSLSAYKSTLEAVTDDRSTQTAAERVAQLANAYLEAELLDARAQNALAQEEHPGERREELAEEAWEAGRARRKARDDLAVALFSWRAFKNG